MINYSDFAIPLAWPDKTAFGDEKWMAVLKKCGIVKNLNFKVGHAAILLVSRRTGQIDYYDFGRYVSPRGDGRARSKLFDQRLSMQSIAQFSQNTIVNLPTILNELADMEEATHGGGRLLFSIVPNISQIAASQYADVLVTKGPIPYGAFAAGNNSCSRFVAQVLIAGMKPKDRRIRNIKYPETIKPSPLSNITNTHIDGFIGCYDKGELTYWKMNRLRSLQFHWQAIKENLSHKHVLNLGNDRDNGQIKQPNNKPHRLQDNAQWLGGIGEGMWFQVSLVNQDKSYYKFESFTHTGVLVNEVYTHYPLRTFDIESPFEITMQMDGQYFILLQSNTQHLFKKIEDNIYKKTLKVI